jgi:hypothetical protein
MAVVLGVTRATFGRRREAGTEEAGGKHDHAEGEDDHRRPDAGLQREIGRKHESASPRPVSTVATAPSPATQASGRRPRTANLQASRR